MFTFYAVPDVSFSVIKQIRRRQECKGDYRHETKKILEKKNTDSIKEWLYQADAKHL